MALQQLPALSCRRQRLCALGREARRIRRQNLFRLKLPHPTRFFPWDGLAHIFYESWPLVRLGIERMIVAAEKVSELVLLSREYRPALMAFFLRRVHDRAEAEDLTQEVFARLAGKGDCEVACGRAYVFQIASNLIKDRVRRYRTRLDYLSSIGEIEGQSVETIDPFRISASRDSIQAMCAALGELSEITRNAFVLYRLEGMSKAVIAEAFGLSISSIEKHITKATVHLIREFGDER